MMLDPPARPEDRVVVLMDRIRAAIWHTLAHIPPDEIEDAISEAVLQLLLLNQRSPALLEKSPDWYICKKAIWVALKWRTKLRRHVIPSVSIGDASVLGNHDVPAPHDTEREVEDRLFVASVLSRVDHPVTRGFAIGVMAGLSQSEAMRWAHGHKGGLSYHHHKLARICTEELHMQRSDRHA